MGNVGSDFSKLDLKLDKNIGNFYMLGSYDKSPLLKLIKNNKNIYLKLDKKDKKYIYIDDNDNWRYGSDKPFLFKFDFVQQDDYGNYYTVIKKTTKKKDNESDISTMKYIYENPKTNQIAILVASIMGIGFLKYNKTYNILEFSKIDITNKNINDIVKNTLMNPTNDMLFYYTTDKILNKRNIFYAITFFIIISIIIIITVFVIKSNKGGKSAISTQTSVPII